MPWFSSEHHSPSWIIESITSALPMRMPSRARVSMYGQLLIDSMPPATATSMSPVAIPCDASMTALSPDPQTLLMVRAATWVVESALDGRLPGRGLARTGGNDVAHDALVDQPGLDAGAGDRLAHHLGPQLGGRRALEGARNFPVGRRAALTMTDSRMRLSLLGGAARYLDSGDGAVAEHLFNRVVSNGRDRWSSRAQCRSAAVTVRAPSPSSSTLVTRSTVRPTATLQANATLPRDSGWSRRSAPSADAVHWRAAVIDLPFAPVGILVRTPITLM